MEVVETKVQRYESYKDSGVEWLGEIPEHWEIEKVKFICEIFNGDSLNESLKKKYESVDSNDLAYISSKDINLGDSTIAYENGLRIPKNKSSLKVAPKNSSLLCIEGGSAGRKVAFTNQEVCFVNKLACFAVTKSNFSKFLFFTLKGSPFQSQFKLSLSGMIGGVSISIINNFSLPIPPLNEQTAIAQFLDDKTTKIDAAIALKKQQINLLKERKQILFHNAVTRGLNADVKFKDSGVEWIGDIPEDWKVTKVKYYSTIFVPERAKPDLNTEGNGFPWVTTEHLRSVELFETAVTYYVSENSKKKTGSRIIKANSVLATCVGNFGIASKLNFDCIINQQIQGFTNLKIDTNYLTYLVRLSEDYFKNNSTLTTIMYVNKDTFGNMPLSLPPLAEQKEISNYIETNSRKIETAIGLKQQEIERLKEYKSSLINSCVTGKVKVC